MRKHLSDRRGFIKGLAVGLAGALFALRGAQPASAESPQFALRIKKPYVVEYFEQRPAELQALLDAITQLWDAELADDGGPPLTEPAARAEWIALGKESMQWQARQELMGFRSGISLLRSLRLRKGEFVPIIFTIKEYRDGILTHTGERFQTVWRGFDGDVALGETGITLSGCKASLQQLLAEIANPTWPIEK